MKIVLFGKNGQVGQELQRTLAPLGSILALGSEDVDLNDLDALRNALSHEAPDIIVNAAAYTAVDQAESDEATAFRINAEVPEVMARYARFNGSLLVHYSTEYVFDGQKSGAYTETDATNPLNVYGQSKRAGERAIQGGGCHALIFRTSWVFSAPGHNFINTILRLARERDTLSVVSDQLGAPTSAELLADVTALAIASCQSDALREGLYHLTASGSTSWYGLACYIVQQAKAKGMELKLDVPNIHAIKTIDYPTPAKRPRNSRMDCSSLSEQLGITLPHWKIHVDRMLDQVCQSGS